MMLHRVYTCIGIFLVLASLQVNAAVVQGARLWHSPDKVRIVFDVDSSVSFKAFSLDNPHRYVVDIEGASLGTKLTDLQLEQSVVKKIRTGQQKNAIRIVFDLKQPVRPSSFALQPNNQYGHRLVVDLYDVAADVEIAPEPAKPIKSLSMLAQPRDVIVAIDAGHGGEDPGAIGQRGTREKDITLAIAKKLKERIDKQSGMRAVLIRTSDYYVSLRKRIQLARKAKADLLVSIHADSFRDKRVRGSSVFMLSEKGASSETARWLASRENRSDLIGGVGSVTLKDKDKVLASVLLDLSMTATNDASYQVGSKVLRELGKVNALHKKYVERAGFVVLKSPDIPSILVETAFISNKAEEKKLRKGKHQEKMASAILKGIKNYFTAYPPAGTTFAFIEHQVGEGESLSSIAKDYGIQINDLSSMNRLSTKHVKIGQILKLPNPAGRERYATSQ